MKILYANDGSELAVEAQTLLDRLAARERIDITVMSVTHKGVPAPEHLPIVLDPLEERRADTGKIVEAAVENLRASGFRAEGLTAEGHPGPEIVDALEAGEYEMVLLGAGRRSWLGRRLLGSVSTFVLHSSPVSVLIVNEVLPQGRPASVLVGADGSEPAEQAAGLLVRFADLERVRVSVLAVVPPEVQLVPVPGLAGGVVAGEVRTDALYRRLREQAAENGERIKATLDEAGFKSSCLVRDGAPTECLLRESDEGGHDLVVVGSRGLGPVRRALVGSVSDQVVRHARATLVGRRRTS